MGSLVTVNARQLAMFSSGFAETFGNIVVAGTTEGNRRVFRRHDFQRHMGIVAGQTIRRLLPVLMGFMAFGALGDPAVNIMAEGAGVLCMLARVFVDPFDFLLMTGAALGFGVLRQFEGRNGHMGVGMTAKAIFQLKMCRAFMAA